MPEVMPCHAFEKAFVCRIRNGTFQADRINRWRPTCTDTKPVMKSRTECLEKTHDISLSVQLNAGTGDLVVDSS